MIEDSLVKLIPLINEANLCAEKFNKDVTFEAKLATVIPDSHSTFTVEEKTNILIKVYNHEYGEQYLWSEDKFQDRLYVIRELVNTYFDTCQIPFL